jgi:hypothetical protein
MTLGNAAASVRLIVWCKGCQHQIEPDPAEMAERYGAETTVPDWAARLVCGLCGSRRVNMVVSGTHLAATGPRKDSSRPTAAVRFSRPRRRSMPQSRRCERAPDPACVWVRLGSAWSSRTGRSITAPLPSRSRDGARAVTDRA